MVEPDVSLSADHELSRGTKPFSQTFDEESVSMLSPFTLSLGSPPSSSFRVRARIMRRRYASPAQVDTPSSSRPRTTDSAMDEAMRSDRWSSVAGVMTGLLAPIVGLGGIVGELGSMLGDIARIPPDPPACEPSGSSPPLVLNERGARERFFICRRCWAGEICAREG